MAKLSRQTKETIKTIAVLIIVILLLITYAIYPLNNSDTLFARADIDEFNIDSLPPNDIGIYANSNWVVDTFRVEPDGLTSLACLYIEDTLRDSTYGTIIVIPSSDTTRDSQVPLIKELISNSYNCITYDQRASGLSSGKHHGFGFIEATDLQEIISYLGIHDQIEQPLYVIGFELGADASIICSKEELRIKKVIAIEPFLSTDNVIESAKNKQNSIWFPFYNSVMYWWYDKNAGYAPEYIEIENFEAVTCPTLLLTKNINKEVDALKVLCEGDILTVDDHNSESISKIIKYLNK